MKLKKFFLQKLSSPIIIGEISANHNGSINTAKKLIKCAKDNKLDFVKLQSYEEYTMTLQSSKKDFQIKKGLWKNRTLWDLYKKAKTPLGWHKELFLYSKKIGIKCFSTPFDESAVDLLEKLGCPMYKISSFEMNHLPLLKRVAETKKPIIISTGMATLKEIDETVKIIKKFGCGDFALLYCISNYPAEVKDFNLKSIEILKNRYGCTVGLSDHSVNNDVAKLSLFFGAMIIEKHIALDNQKKGFDIEFSIKGKKILEFKNELTAIYKILKSPSKFYTDKKNIIYRRSIYSAEVIKKGDFFTKSNLRIIRPGYGLQPKYYHKIIGKKAAKNISYAVAINKKHISK
jgi:pseudaminic acid synthase